MLLMAPASGDELQGIKRGIVEVADLVVVNKYDGGLKSACRLTSSASKTALTLMPAKVQGWNVPVQRCSALTGTGVDEVWTQLRKFQTFAKESGQLVEKRREQNRRWMMANFQSNLQRLVSDSEELRQCADDMQHRLVERELTPRQAADLLIDVFIENM